MSMTPEQAQEEAEWDRCETALIDRLPRLWAGMYKRLIAEGVLAVHATQMICTYIANMGKEGPR